MENNNKDQNQDQQSLCQNSMICSKDDHESSPFICIKFSKNKDQFFQCIKCVLEDPEIDRKIILEQLFNNPNWKIKNFPPLTNKSQEKEIKECLENFTQEKIHEYKNRVKCQIEHSYEVTQENMIKSLAQQKKHTIQQFEDLFVFSNIEELYNLEPLKQHLKQFESKEIDFEKLYEFQLKVKENFEEENKPIIVLEQKMIQQEIDKQLNNLQQQLNEKIAALSTNIQINKDFLSKLYKNNQQQKQQQEQIACDSQQKQDEQNTEQQVQNDIQVEQQVQQQVTNDTQAEQQAEQQVEQQIEQNAEQQIVQNAEQQVQNVQQVEQQIEQVQQQVEQQVEQQIEQQVEQQVEQQA